MLFFYTVKVQVTKPENNCLFTFKCLFHNRQINIGNENSYHKPLPQSSCFNKKYYYPVRTTTYLWILLEMRKGNGQCNFSFNKAVILKRILNIFKSALTGLPYISNLSVNTDLYSYPLSAGISWILVPLSSFVTQKTIFKDCIRKKLKSKQFK